MTTNNLSEAAAGSLFRCIDGAEPEFYGFLKQMVSIESCSGDTEGIDRLGDSIADFARRKGFTPVRHPFPLAGNGLVLSSPGTEEKKPLCFIAHLDTVHAKGSFARMLEEADGCLYGPGVVDCKGGIAVALLAMTALRQAGFTGRPLKLVLTPDEEVSTCLSGEEGIAFIQSETKDCAAAITCECGTNGEAVVQRKGILKADITIAGKAAHAGMHYDRGVSAVREAARKILALENRSHIGRITYNCGLIQGGTAYNVVPEHCRIGVDIRFGTSSEQEEAMRVLEEVAGQSYVPGTTSQIRLYGRRPPMEKTDGGMELFELIRRTGERYGLEELSPLLNGGGSDAAYSAQTGTPSICGMGITGRDWHTTEERAEIASLARRAKLLAATAAQME